MRFYCASGLRSICAPWGRTTGQQQHSPTSQIPKKTTGVERGQNASSHNRPPLRSDRTHAALPVVAVGESRASVFAIQRLMEGGGRSDCHNVGGVLAVGSAAERARFSESHSQHIINTETTRRNTEITHYNKKTTHHNKPATHQT